MDCSLPGSSVHGIFQARVLEWVAVAFSSLTLLANKKSLVQSPWEHTCGHREAATEISPPLPTVNLFLLNFSCSSLLTSFPGSAGGKEPTCQFRSKRRGFAPWAGKIPWRRAWQPTTVLLPGEFHGQRSLVGDSSWHHKESDTTETT